MGGKTVTRSNLSQAVFQASQVQRKDCDHLVEGILRHISDALSRGEKVVIKNFGTFHVLE